MKVFLSWSRPLSHAIAQAFADWLPKVLQECRDPFVSSDTDKGEAWFQAITSELRESKVGVVFITTENLNDEWTHLEAGAINAALDKRLCPILVNLRKTDYDGPLRNLQMTELADKGDMLKLVRTLNKQCDSPLHESVLDSTFDIWWPALEKAVEKALKDSTDVRPVEKRTTADKIDELLLLVRGLGVQVAKSQDDAFTTRRERREREMRMFRERHPESKFAAEGGQFLGPVQSARPLRNDDWVTQVLTGDGPVLRKASELDFSDVPF